MKGFLFDGVSVEIDPRSATVGGSWQGRDGRGQVCAYDSNLLKFFLSHLKPGDIFLDIGANTGSFSLLGTQMNINCVSFEPNPEIIPILKENIHLNGCERVQIEEVALSDHSGECSLCLPPSGESGLACLQESPRFRTRSTTKVILKTLDSYNFDRINSLKIDVEGAELLVIKGAENTLRRCHPSIMIEFDERNTPAFGYDRNVIVEVLKTFGYDNFQQMGESGRDLWVS